MARSSSPWRFLERSDVSSEAVRLSIRAYQLFESVRYPDNSLSDFRLDELREFFGVEFYRRE
jgi:hypothetical protein